MKKFKDYIILTLILIPITAVGHWPLYDMIAIPLFIGVFIYGYYKIKKFDQELDDWKKELDLLPDHEATVSDFKEAIEAIHNDADLSEKDKQEFIKDFEHEIRKLEKN